MIRLATIFLVSLFVSVSFAGNCKASKACPSENQKTCAKLKEEKEKEHGATACCKKDNKSKCCKESKEKVSKAQTNCPVMGSAIEVGKSQYVDVKGKRIYICCSGCIDPIKKNPDKFIKKLEDDGITLEAVPN